MTAERIVQRSPEWYEARRLGITSTDIPAILGISPWHSEGDVARDKAGTTVETEDAERDRRFRIGRGLEAVIAAEDEVEHGYPLVAMPYLLRHPTIEWAITSLDFTRADGSAIVEAKSSSSRDWANGLPESVEAQVRWQMGVAGYPTAHVAALLWGRDLVCFDVAHDAEAFDGLVQIAADFRTRLAAGGPFEENRASVRRAWPADDGTTLDADADMVEAVDELIRVIAAGKAAKARREALETAIQMKMGPASALVGPGWGITYRRAKDTRVTDWQALAEDALLTLALSGVDPEPIRAEFTTSRPGARRFLVKPDKPTEEDEG